MGGLYPSLEHGNPYCLFSGQRIGQGGQWQQFGNHAALLMPLSSSKEPVASACLGGFTGLAKDHLTKETISVVECSM